MKAFLCRLAALTLKEFRQTARDVSNILIGLALPIVLLLIFGFGLSLDVEHAPVAVVMEKDTPLVRDLLSKLNGSVSFAPRYVSSMHEAEAMMRRREVDAILHTSSDFDSRFAQGRAEVQLILHGVDSTTATLISQYASGMLAQSVRARLERSGRNGGDGSVVVQGRIWFNEASTSTWYLIPGLIVIIMTLVGAFLTALVMAREWERGTLEALFVTPAGRVEILLAKMAPSFLLGLIGLLLCLGAARWVFSVPLRGSLIVFLLCSTLYLVTALGMGLAISSVTRRQFLACQITIVASFLPAVILSGFLFDLRSVPAIARIVGQILPATYYMELIKTLILAGDNPSIIFRNCLALAGYATFFLSVALRFTRKTLD